MSMGRGKTELKQIANAKQRHASFRKRGNSLRKKASELSTLCGVDVGVVVYGEGESSKPEVWPSEPHQATRVIECLKSMPELDQRKNMLDAAGLLRERVTKLQVEVREAEIDRRERETKLLLHDAIVGRHPGLAGLTYQQLASVCSMGEDRANKIRERIEFLREQQGVQPPPPYATTGADVDAPPQQGWGMEVYKAGLDVDSVPYSVLGNGGGSNGNAGAGGDMMQLGNTCSRTDSRGLIPVLPPVPCEEQGGHA